MTVQVLRGTSSFPLPLNLLVVLLEGSAYLFNILFSSDVVARKRRVGYVAGDSLRTIAIETSIDQVACGCMARVAQLRTDVAQPLKGKLAVGRHLRL